MCRSGHTDVATRKFTRSFLSIPTSRLSFLLYCHFLLIFSFSFGKKGFNKSVSLFSHDLWLSCKTKPLTRPLGIYLRKSLKYWAETEFQHTLGLICCFKGQLKGKERKWRIGRLLFRLLQHLQQLRQAWTRNPRSNPLTRSRITVSQWTQRELLFVRLYIFSTDLQTSRFWSELLHAAELHLCFITAVWGAKLASGNTKPLVDLSQHVTGDVLRTSRS